MPKTAQVTRAGNRPAARRRGVSAWGRLVTLALVCALAGLLLLGAPGAAMRGASNGLTLCAEVLIPSLFPFLCLTCFVVQCGLAEKAGRLLEAPTRHIFRLPGSAAVALLLGVIGGYPAGATAVASLCQNGSLSRRDGNRLLSFCINSGPSFIIGAVGAGVLKSPQAGLLLYAAHITASLVIGVCTRFSGDKSGGGKRSAPAAPLPPAQAFVGSVAAAAAGMLNICAFVVLFATLVSLLAYTGVLPLAATLLAGALPASGLNAAGVGKLLTGIFEVSNGCAAAASAKGMAAVLMCSAMLSWSGLSVQCQVMAAVRGAGLSTKGYLAVRIFHIVLALGLTLLLFRLFPVALPVFASADLPITATVHSAPASAALLLLTAMLLLARLRV